MPAGIEWARAYASTRCSAGAISSPASSRDGVSAWFERPRSSPGVARNSHPVSVRSQIVAGQARAACASSRRTSSRSIGLHELEPVAPRILGVEPPSSRERLIPLDTRAGGGESVRDSGKVPGATSSAGWALRAAANSRSTPTCSC
jgi:hypothetical protein